MTAPRRCPICGASVLAARLGKHMDSNACRLTPARAAYLRERGYAQLVPDAVWSRVAAQRAHILLEFGPDLTRVLGQGPHAVPWAPVWFVALADAAMRLSRDDWRTKKAWTVPPPWLDRWVAKAADPSIRGALAGVYALGRPNAVFDVLGERWDLTP